MHRSLSITITARVSYVLDERKSLLYTVSHKKVGEFVIKKYQNHICSSMQKAPSLARRRVVCCSWQPRWQRSDTYMH